MLTAIIPGGTSTTFYNTIRKKKCVQYIPNWILCANAFHEDENFLMDMRKLNCCGNTYISKFYVLYSSASRFFIWIQGMYPRSCGIMQRTKKNYKCFLHAKCDVNFATGVQDKRVPVRN